MIEINHLYNAGSISQDISNLCVRMFRSGVQVYERSLNNCRIENQTLFADHVFDIPERFDSVRIFSGNEPISEAQSIRIDTEPTDGAQYMVIWNNSGICPV